MAARVNKVADILHLREILDRLPGQISEGEKQRVAVARAIVRDPNCFLFDEPLSRLDVELRHSMRGQIKAVLSNLSKATVIVTHDQLEALTMADRIAIMRDGLIEQVGSPHEVFAKPANVFVASFIGTPQMNLIEAQFKSYGNGKAKVAFDEQDVDLSVNPAVANLKPGKVTVGIRPRAFTVVSEDTSGHDRRPGRAHRADGCRDAYPRAHQDRQRHPGRRAARQEGEDRRGAPPRSGSRANPRVRRRRKGGARMSNGEQGNGGLTPTAARTLEYSIIGLGVLALLMIFQPFNITLFTVGCALVVLAGLVNNLLPLAQPGVPKRSRGERWPWSSP